MDTGKTFVADNKARWVRRWKQRYQLWMDGQAGHSIYIEYFVCWIEDKEGMII